MSEATEEKLSPPARGLENVRAALKGLRYGEVRIVVQDGVIVQIERIEKIRLSKGGRASEAGS